MPLSRSRDYLSIGEVLDQIRPDFPDVSISKIRFLESEGLIAPTRTGSGYRKFYSEDVKRLRYILTLQRDQFLPLKVIRDRLADIDGNGGGYPKVAEDKGPRLQERPAERPVEQVVETLGLTLTRAELKDAAGASEAELKGLEEFGILQASEGGTYDENDLMVAKAARGFFRFGVEPRHLRMYKQFAEREGSFFEQIVLPVLRKKDPEAREQAAQSLRELMRMARQMREGALRSNLREML